MPSITKYLASRRRQVERALKRSLPPAGTRPARIHQAMRYSLFIGGKRVRPILCLAACEAEGGKATRAMDIACALELIHTYSLIHDDLPCMDNDDLRRGKPTSHKVYGEAMAVLAGDALLTEAFALIARNRAALPPRVVHALSTEIARAAGSRWLIGGQVEDLQAEGKKLPLSRLQGVHERKTAALIEASVVCGALAAGKNGKRLGPWRRYGKAIGLAFQVADDLLDVVGEEKKMGKRVRKDYKHKKATYPALLGIPGTLNKLKGLHRQALRSLDGMGRKAEPLRELAKYITSRDN